MWNANGLTLEAGAIIPEAVELKDWGWQRRIEQGRFFTLNGAVVRATSPLGLVIAGPLADTFGARILWVIAGVGLVGLAVTRLLTPEIWLH